jgi:hypothetical protein
MHTWSNVKYLLDGRSKVSYEGEVQRAEVASTCIKLLDSIRFALIAGCEVVLARIFETCLRVQQKTIAVILLLRLAGMIEELLCGLEKLHDMLNNDSDGGEGKR